MRFLLFDNGDRGQMCPLTSLLLISGYINRPREYVGRGAEVPCGGGGHEILAHVVTISGISPLAASCSLLRGSLGRESLVSLLASLVSRDSWSSGGSTENRLCTRVFGFLGPFRIFKLILDIITFGCR